MNILKILGLAVCLALVVGGCTGVNGVTEKYPSEGVKDYFAAANETSYLGVLTMSSQKVDLTAYTPYMGVKYPPTARVDVLYEKPSRPFQAFAVLQGTERDVSPTVLAQLTDKAKTIGADAIIINQHPAGADARAEAVAIKYRLEPEEARKRP